MQANFNGCETVRLFVAKCKDFPDVLVQKGTNPARPAGKTCRLCGKGCSCKTTYKRHIKEKKTCLSHT